MALLMMDDAGSSLLKEPSILSQLKLLYEELKTKLLNSPLKQIFGKTSQKVLILNKLHDQMKMPKETLDQVVWVVTTRASLTCWAFVPGSAFSSFRGQPEDCTSESQRRYLPTRTCDKPDNVIKAPVRLRSWIQWPLFFLNE